MGKINLEQIQLSQGHLRIGDVDIYIAKHSGFCFGVKRAIEKTEQRLETREKERDFHQIATFGPLIHNENVTDALAQKGAFIADELEKLSEGDTIIVRSHGEGKAFYDQAQKMGLQVEDATCPFVTKIHKIVHKGCEEGRHILIIGDSKHPEVRGIIGWCMEPGTVEAINSLEETSKLLYDKYLVVCQTTIKHQLLQDILEQLQQMNVELEVINTICSATTERQNSCQELAKEVDAMIVIGGRNSSNTRKLFEIAKKNCKNSFFVENIIDLPLKDLEKYNKIGIAAGASTPECIIKEVIANMSEKITNENMSMADFMDQIDASLRLPRTGEIIDGTVHQVTEKEVIVNLGCKKDGILPADEVILQEGQKLTDLFKEGDEIQAKVLKMDDGDGGILLSKKKLEINEHWKEITQALEDKSTITVKVVKAVNGGVIAAYKEVSGFIPLSQLSDRYVETADEFIGQELEVRVTRVDQRKNRAVFSHKLVLNDEKQKQVEAIWDGLAVDDIIEGTVMRFTDYGAFIDIGGIDGLLHISEISWGKLKHPQEILKIGEKVKVKILSMNEEKGKISLGLKQTTPEPWSVIEENYKVGQVVTGKVVQLKEYGAFVELEPGLDGLVHISEVANNRVSNIGDELTLGQEVSAKILDIDTERKRISLSIKATMEAPEAAEEEQE